MKPRLLWVLMLAVAGVAVYTGNAQATPSSGFAGVTTAKARGELSRVSGRRPAEALTPAERRVATLVAEGKTNREVAAALFLGERTIASHLTHVYAKLGVRSRTELARRLQAGDPR